MPQPAPERQEVFISYTRDDRQWVDRLQQMMKPLLRAGGQRVRLWDDSQIVPGAKWRSEIEAALARAKVAVLLVSDAFLASEFVMNEEVPKLLAAAEAEGVRVLWVSLSPCLVEHTPIHAYQAVLPLDHYLEELAKPQQQRALKTIAERIREALLEPVPSTPGLPPPTPPGPELLPALPEPPRAAIPPPQPQTSSAPAELARQTFRLETARLLRVETTQGIAWPVQRQPLRVEGALEELAPGVTLPLVWIPAGEFVMGSPADEPERFDCEGPQHSVRLEAFWMGQTPITQAQWRVVAEWREREGERWGRELRAFPSRFQGEGKGEARLLEGEASTEQRPVEKVSWEEAMEFCHRLSQRTGRTFTLPSEAQWEYACRAGSAKPFAFGETLTAELANYDASQAYGNGPRGERLRQTTPVGRFPANAWGLWDMHGNVWEWCLDEWHGSYEGAPEDGSAWVQAGEGNNRSAQQGEERRLEGRLLRGGSW